MILLDRVSRREHGDPQIEELNIGEAAEPEGRGTGEHGRKDSCHTAVLKMKKHHTISPLLLQHHTSRWH